MGKFFILIITVSFPGSPSFLAIIPRIMTFDLPQEGVGADVQLLGVQRDVVVCQQQWIYCFHTTSLCSDIGGNITDELEARYDNCASVIVRKPPHYHGMQIEYFTTPSEFSWK